MDPIGPDNLSVVLDALGPERAALLELLGGLAADDWDRPTECPAYPIKGIASHILGDDLSLLSRQRDGATQGLFLMAEKMPGSDFRALLNGFNDQWVEAVRFMSPPLLLELLRLSGRWTEDYYRDVDPTDPGEPVPMFTPTPGEPSPFWQAIAREYLERLAHHGQIRRALGQPSLDGATDAQHDLLDVAIRIVATAAELPAVLPTSDGQAAAVGPIVLGPAAQAADILTLAHTEQELLTMLDGPAEPVALFAARLGRRIED